MRHKHNIFWIESKDKQGKETIVGHSKDDETGEIFYQFLSRASANKLLEDEKKVSPEYQYRIVRQVTETFKTEWE